MMRSTKKYSKAKLAINDGQEIEQLWNDLHISELW